MTAPLKTPLSSSWSLQMTPHWSASSRTEMRRSWLSGAVTTTWSSTRSKLWRWSWTSGETPLFSSHSPSWTALWLQWSHSGSWVPEVGRSHRLRLSWDCASLVNWKSSTCHRRVWQFYSAVIESVLCCSITVWFGSASKSDIRRLQRTVRTAERIIGVHLPSLQDLYFSRGQNRAGDIITDPSHPGHDLFALLPSDRRYRSLCTRTSSHKNSSPPPPPPRPISSLNN